MKKRVKFTQFKSEQELEHWSEGREIISIQITSGSLGDTYYQVWYWAITGTN